MEPGMTFHELAFATVGCTRCGALPGELCRIPELDGRMVAPPQMHQVRYDEAEQLVESAIAYGLIERVPAKGGPRGGRDL